MRARGHGGGEAAERAVFAVLQTVRAEKDAVGFPLLGMLEE